MEEIKLVLTMRKNTDRDIDINFWNKQLKTLNDSLKQIRTGCSIIGICDNKDGDTNNGNIINTTTKIHCNSTISSQLTPRTMFDKIDKKPKKRKNIVSSSSSSSDDEYDIQLAATQQDISQQQFRMVKVRAPSDLPEGFQFSAKKDGKEIKAIVVSVFK